MVADSSGAHSSSFLITAARASAVHKVNSYDIKKEFNEQWFPSAGWSTVISAFPYSYLGFSYYGSDYITGQPANRTLP